MSDREREAYNRTGYARIKRDPARLPCNNCKKKDNCGDFTFCTRYEMWFRLRWREIQRRFGVK